MPRIDTNTGLKQCSKCKAFKEATAFSLRSTPDGLHYWCKACVSADTMKRYHTDPLYHQQANRRSIDHFKAKYARDPEFKRQHNRQTSAWSRARYATDPIFRQWKLDYHAAYKRKAIRDGTLTSSILWRLYCTWTGMCPFCLTVAEPSLDHIIPISQGGLHSLSNVQLMCKMCNSSKNDLTMDEWLSRRTT